MKPGDLEYYRARLATERRALERARHPLAAESHRRLAEGYARLLVADDAAPASAPATASRS